MYNTNFIIITIIIINEKRIVQLLFVCKMGFSYKVRKMCLSEILITLLPIKIAISNNNRTNQMTFSPYA